MKIIRVLLAIFMTLLFSGCADIFVNNKKSNNVSLVPEVSNIFVATSRQKEMSGEFNSNRSLNLSYEKYQAFIPPLRRAGNFVYPQISKNIKYSFRIAKKKEIKTANDFNNVVLGELNGNKKIDEVLVYVHGFNYSYEKSIFRLAQIDADFNLPAVNILYSWPTANKIKLYLRDIDSAAFARDGLEELLVDLSNSEIKKIVLVGHSLGASIIMETLRQLKFKKKNKIFTKISGVALLSPDIDVDLFALQAKEIGKLPQPFVVYSSKKDWILREFANFFHDGKERLGSISDYSPLKGLKLTIIDSSNINDNSNSYHFAAVSSPSMIALINSMPNVGFDSFGNYARSGNIKGAKIITDGAMSKVVLAGF